MTEYFTGLDCSQFPELAVTSWLKHATGASWIGFYLGPAPSHRDAGWMDQRAALIEQGWGLAPIFVGQQLAGPGSHQVTTSQGTTDGAAAAALMAKAGFPERSNCFLDLEDGPPLTSPRTDYVKAWAAALYEGGYYPGVYCSWRIAEDIASLFAGEDVAVPFIWAFRVNSTATHPIGPLPFPKKNPADASPAAIMWQHEHNAQIQTPYGTILIDVNSAAISDPSRR